MTWTTWPELWSSLSYLQGYDALAKQSTRYVATGASITACDTDRSQYGTDLSVGTDCVYEAATTRFNRDGPRTIGLQIVWGGAGTLYQHASAGNLESITIAAEVITANVNGSGVGTLDFSAASPGDVVLVAWATEANPDTTGASDAMQSWLIAINTTTGNVERSAFTHAAKNLVSATAIWGAAATTGTSAYSDDITGIWFENRVQSGAEIAADWYTALADLTTDSETDHEHQGIPVDADTLDDVAGGFHGPSIQWAADATRRLIRRTLSPLVNHRFRVRPEWSDAGLAGTPFLRLAPNSTNYTMSLAWLFAAPVPDTCSHVWVRVHLRSRVTSGAAVPLGVRLYSMSRPLGALGIAGVGGPAAATEIYYCQATLTRDDAGVGEYTVVGYTRIARGTSGIRDGMTYLALAFAVDPAAASANDAAARFTLQALHVVPDFRPGGIQGGGFHL